MQDSQTKQVFYRGTRICQEAQVKRVEGLEARDLPWRLDLRNHSPTGLEWGYGGSGPSQLALALLADAVEDDFACQWHQAFKWAVVAGLPYEGWRLSLAEVREWSQRRRAEQPGTGASAT